MARPPGAIADEQTGSAGPSGRIGLLEVVVRCHPTVLIGTSTVAGASIRSLVDGDGPPR